MNGALPAAHNASVMAAFISISNVTPRSPQAPEIAPTPNARRVHDPADVRVITELWCDLDRSVTVSPRLSTFTANNTGHPTRISLRTPQ